MRIMLWVDMEGTAGIDDYRACLPAYRQYWETGREALTADVIAAAKGLHTGGATAVYVTDIHGPGWFKNVIAERLPHNLVPAAGIVNPDDVDAAFHLGFHARCGTADGFMSHTHVPEFRIKVNDALVTENHVLAWISGVPVLGVTGDRALAPELDEALHGTPFLEVKRSSDRTNTVLRYSDPDDRAAAIRDFAAACVQAAQERVPPMFPPNSEVVISMSPQYIDSSLEAQGLQRRSAATLAVTGSDWNHDIWPRVRMAARAATWVLDEFASQLDLTDPDVVTNGDQPTLQRLRDRFDAWMNTVHPAWEA